MAKQCNYWPGDEPKRCEAPATHAMYAEESRHEILGYLCWPHKRACIEQKIRCRIEPLRGTETTEVDS